jgi:hypothetical protein
MRGISAGIAACAVAAVAVGCGSVQAPRSGSAAPSAVSATAGTPTTNPAVPTNGARTPLALRFCGPGHRFSVSIIVLR